MDNPNTDISEHLEPTALATQGRRVLAALEEDGWWTGGIEYLRRTLQNFPTDKEELRMFCWWLEDAELHISQSAERLLRKVRKTIDCVDIDHLRELRERARCTPGGAVLHAHLERLVVELGAIETELSELGGDR